ncbi:hypothetical protein [Kineococcus rhizosphaerae]|uniref:Uncharacterized protein n=1 Tax=Kineococcus rhizosphaerae TaxID=559628 RepID=A0A2T0R5K6_9ACTN|nr:hypothetical protein [Kineococcus rhizosphaerae]PRY15997.1 hypothetical protein CLV37_104210 [Kineococcus rhizosphaerae]
MHDRDGGRHREAVRTVVAVTCIAGIAGAWLACGWLGAPGPGSRASR